MCWYVCNMLFSRPTMVFYSARDRLRVRCATCCAVVLFTVRSTHVQYVCSIYSTRLWSSHSHIDHQPSELAVCQTVSQSVRYVHTEYSTYGKFNRWRPRKRSRKRSRKRTCRERDKPCPKTRKTGKVPNFRNVQKRPGNALTFITWRTPETLNACRSFFMKKRGGYVCT